MRIPNLYPISDDRGEIKMTPMIDAVFLLLIFFLLTSTFQINEQLLPSRLPPNGALNANIDLPEELKDLDQITIKLFWIQNQLSVELNDTRYDDVGSLRQILLGTPNSLGLGQIEPDIPVILDIAGEVPLESMVDVFDLCRLASFTNIHFAASRASLSSQ